MSTKFEGTLLVVDDIERSKGFYKELFDLDVICDFGANATLKGGISLQTKDSWIQFIGSSENDIRYKGNDTELYFVGTDVIGFDEKARRHGVEYLHGIKEMPWGQRVVRIYDPDHHLIEVGEDMVVVAKRLLSEGMSAEDVSAKTMFPLDAVRSFA